MRPFKTKMRVSGLWQLFHIISYLKINQKPKPKLSELYQI